MGATGERDPSSRHAAALVEDHERRLRFLTDNVPTVMLYQFEMDAQGARRFTYVSAGVEAMHGLTAEQVVADASLLYAQLDEADRSRVYAAEERSSEDVALYGGVADGEAHFLAKPYSVCDLSSRVREVLDAAARS